MIKVGLTGGIGSGKTLVSEIFSQLGIPVFNADKEAKIILNKDTEVVNQITNTFGDVYNENEIDRKKLASIIFNNTEALNKINSIVHPKVLEYFKIWKAKQINVRYVIKEAAILFESNSNMGLDATINIHADELIRINRVVQRDNSSFEEVKSRIKNQLNDSERIKLADFTIYNNGNEMLLPQILKVHNKILKIEK